MHVAEVTGLLDHLARRPEGSADVFDLAEGLGVDYDRMTAVVHAAEQLGYVTTPGDVVLLTLEGRQLSAADLEDLTIFFPFIPAQALFETLVEWGRVVELLDHDPSRERLWLTDEGGT